MTELEMNRYIGTLQSENNLLKRRQLNMSAEIIDLRVQLDDYETLIQRSFELSREIIKCLNGSN